MADELLIMLLCLLSLWIACLEINVALYNLYATALHRRRNTVLPRHLTMESNPACFFLLLFVLTAWISSVFGWIWLSLNIISRQHERFENGGSSTGLLLKFTAGSTFCACSVKHSSFPLNKINEGSGNEIVWPAFWD